MLQGDIEARFIAAKAACPAPNRPADPRWMRWLMRLIVWVAERRLRGGINDPRDREAAAALLSMLHGRLELSRPHSKGDAA
jgi:hypothetical protein